MTLLVLSPKPAIAEELSVDQALAAIERAEGGDKLRVLMGEVVARQRATTSLAAEFRQERRSTLLLEPVVSTGVFRYLKPDRVRWDYAAPDPMLVLFVDEILTTWHLEDDLVEVVELSDRQQRMLRFIAAPEPLDELTVNFSVSLADTSDGGPFRLVMTPNHRVLQRRLHEVRLEIDRAVLLPSAIEYRATSGDVTRYDFSSIERNPTIDPALFVLELPDEVEVLELEAPR